MSSTRQGNCAILLGLAALCASGRPDDSLKPYSPPCTERENVFAFAEKPAVKNLGNDRYEITFATKANCDATAGIVDDKGVVVRHLGAGVLGPNAPEPFQKNSLKQTIYWDGKDDLAVYHKEPDKLKVRVSLGLKPEFDKLLGCVHPKNLPGRVWGVAVDEQGVYVFVMGTGRGHITVRKFNHDTEYLATIWPPPANLPPEKLGGMGFVEYEPGKRAIQSPNVNRGIWRESYWMPDGIESSFGLFSCRPAAAGGRVYFVNSGFLGSGSGSPKFRVKAHYLNADGSTEYDGLKGWTWQDHEGGARECAVALSPDGGTLYMVGLGSPSKDSRKKASGSPVLLGGSVRDRKPAAVLAGEKREPGSDARHFSMPVDVACDAEGRIYVADMHNNRVQVLAPDGKPLKAIQVDRPTLVQVHRKTGAVYVAHQSREKGQSVECLGKFGAFPDLAPVKQWQIGPIDVMTLDSWSARPRLWISSESFNFGAYAQDESIQGHGLRVFEDTGPELKAICDFDEDARKAAGRNYTGRWDGGMYQDIACDPVREKVYYKKKHIFDLKTGTFAGWFGGKAPSDIARSGFSNGHNVEMRGCDLGDIAFDKRGYMHGHVGVGFDCGKAIVRMDPERPHKDGGYVEVPYDYGDSEMARWNNQWSGVVPSVTTESETFSCGFGVNMQGDMAVGLRVLYSPKMEAEAFDEKASDLKVRKSSGYFFGPNLSYEKWQKDLQEFQKRGEELFSVKREPGIPLTGSVLTTYDRTGEKRSFPALVPGQRSNGVQMDEEGFLYFTNARFRMMGDKPFLSGRGGNFGGAPIHKSNELPFAGVYMKCRDRGVRFLLNRPAIPYDDLPKRPPDLAEPPDPTGWAWVEKAEWLYAGSSPIVEAHCDCPQMRAWLDWYKRSFVPEAYRHSVGVLDTNGNLILHIGQYGNFDSGAGPDSKVPTGGDGIATTMVRYVSGTDNYLCLLDWGQRLIVAKLDYHAAETVPIPAL